MVRSEYRQHLEAIFRAGLEAVDPAQAVARAVTREGDTLLVCGRAYPLDQYERVFVIERGGLVYAVGPDAAVPDEPFADLSDVAHRGSIEQGLLGFAFHPSRPERVFVYHSRSDNDNQLVEYTVVDDRLDSSSASVLLVVDRSLDRPVREHHALRVCVEVPLDVRVPVRPDDD